MASPPLKRASGLLIASLLLTAAMAFSTPGLRQTLTLRLPGSGLPGADVADDPGRANSSRAHTGADVVDAAPETGPAVAGRPDPPAVDTMPRPFPASVDLLADGPTSGLLETSPVTRRPTTAASQVRRRGYEELPAPPDVGLPPKLHDPEDSTPLPPLTAAIDAAPLRELVAELSLLRRDLHEMAREPRPPAQQEPVALSLAAVQNLQRLDALHADIRRIADRQSELESTLRTDLDRHIAQLQPAPTAAPPREAPAEVELTPLPDRSGVWNARFVQAAPASIVRGLAPLGPWNLVISSEVAGTATLSLPAASPDEILQGVAAALGCIIVDDGAVRLLLPRSRAGDYRIATERTLAKFIRPGYVEAADLLPCIEPLLTPGLGSAALTSTANSEGTVTPAAPHRDALLVVDFPEVLAQVEALVAEVDVPPEQFEIEAVITTVRSRTRTAGSIVTELQSRGLCEGATLGTTCSPGTICGRYRGSASDLLAVLGSVAETHVDATPTLHVLNRQPAYLEIGEQVGYRQHSRFLRRFTLAAEKIDFLPSTTSLTVRPFLQGAETVRLQVESGVSHFRFDSATHLPRHETACLRTDLNVPLGCTAVIGGLLRQEQTHELTPASRGWWKWRCSDAAIAASDDLHTEVLILLTPRRCGETTSAPPHSPAHHTPAPPESPPLPGPPPGGSYHPPAGPRPEVPPEPIGPAALPLNRPTPRRISSGDAPSVPGDLKLGRDSGAEVEAPEEAGRKPRERTGRSATDVAEEPAGRSPEAAAARRRDRDLELASVPPPPEVEFLPPRLAGSEGVVHAGYVPPSPPPAAASPAGWVPPPPAR